MKNTILILAIFFLAIQTKAQTINANHWCINSIQVLTDTNGIQYTEIDLYNNDAILDSSYNYIAVEGLINGNDTIKPIDNYLFYNHFIYTNSDTSIVYRIDTAIAINSIIAVLVRRGMPGCGIALMENISVNKICGSDKVLGIKNVEKNSIEVYPNPSNGTIHFNGCNSNDVYELSVYSITGELILTQKIKNSIETNLPDATYFYKLKNTNTKISTTGKFLKL